MPLTMSRKLPPPEEFSTFTAISFASGAMLAMFTPLVATMEATSVPCALSSPQTGKAGLGFWFGVNAALSA